MILNLGPILEQLEQVRDGIVTDPEEVREIIREGRRAMEEWYVSTGNFRETLQDAEKTFFGIDRSLDAKDLS